MGTGIWSQGTTLVSSGVATDIANRQVLRYAGYCYDSESGLYYLSARSYDPKTRQFLSKDLSRNDGEQSAYQYCGGNPVSNVDPTGNIICPVMPIPGGAAEADALYNAVAKAQGDSSRRHSGSNSGKNGDAKVNPLGNPQYDVIIVGSSQPMVAGGEVGGAPLDAGFAWVTIWSHSWSDNGYHRVVSPYFKGVARSALDVAGGFGGAAVGAVVGGTAGGPVGVVVGALLGEKANEVLSTLNDGPVTLKLQLRLVPPSVRLVANETTVYQVDYLNPLGVAKNLVPQYLIPQFLQGI